MPLKVLLLSHKFYPDIGGIEVNSEILAQAFYESGHEVRVLTWSKDSTERVFPFAIIRHPNIFSLFREHIWADLVFENNPCIRLGWPNLFSRRPSIIVLNTWLEHSLDIVGWMKSQWIKRARNIISVSHAVRKGCWPTATVISNPYRANIFRVLPNIDRTTSFVFLGRLVSQKGVCLLIKAFHRLVTIMQEANTLPTKYLSLTIIGDGPERDNLERQVTDLHLEKQVTFTGFLQGDELTKCLNQHNFLVVPSVLEEAFGNVVLEGMACGCLPIVSNLGGLPEAVGNAGVVFSPVDLDNLVACMQKLLTSPDLVSKLRNAIPNHLENHHPNAITQQYLQIIKSIELLQ